MTREEYIRWLKLLDDELTFDALVDGKDEMDMHEMIFDLCEKLKQEQKTGRWIDGEIKGDNSILPVQICDQCNTFYPLAHTGGGHRYCPNCGAKMVEPQEKDNWNQFSQGLAKKARNKR